MKRFKALDKYQKGILLLLAAMILVFSAVYPYVLSRKGFLFRDTILIPSQENGNTIYSGRIHGKDAVFTVFADRTIQFTYGANQYGPYLVREAPDAATKEPAATGIEILSGDKLLFRGGAMKVDGGKTYWLIGEDGNLESLNVVVTSGDGTEVTYDGNGNEIDPMAPSMTTIYELHSGPALTHKGVGFAWFVGVFFCGLTAMTILYADELFRWNLSFSIKDADHAEPSEWALESRSLGWILLSILALATFIMGLR